MVKRTDGVPPPPFPPAPPNPFRRAAPTSTALVAPAAVAGPHVTDAMALAFHSALSDGALGSDEVEDIKAGLRAALAAAPTTQPAPQQEALRLAKYVARRKLAKQLDANEIHSLDYGCDTEAVLLLSDIEAVLAQVAALTATQPAAPQQDADEIRSYAAARAWVVRAAQEGQ